MQALSPLEASRGALFGALLPMSKREENMLLTLIDQWIVTHTEATRLRVARRHRAAIRAARRAPDGREVARWIDGKLVQVDGYTNDLPRNA